MGTPFKMKAGKEGPMKKNFPSTFKKDTEPTLPVNESDNTSVNNTSAKIIIDAVNRQEEDDKVKRKTAQRPSTRASNYEKSQGKTDTMFANDPNRPNSFVNKFFEK
jgi:hypothetical protein